MREGQFCYNCKHRPGGCTFSLDPENPIKPNDTDVCCFTPSRWEPKEEFGKLVAGIRDSDPYSPNAGPIFSETPEPDGFSLCCRQSPDGVGSIDYWLKNGDCFDGEGRYLGKQQDLHPQPTEDEIQKVLNWHFGKSSIEPTEAEIQRVFRYAKDNFKLT